MKRRLQCNPPPIPGVFNIKRVMLLSELQRKLMAAARLTPPSDAVPFAFEKRIMARLATVSPLDEWVWWGRALWRGAAACALVALLCSAWSFLPPASHDGGGNGDDLEEAVLASVNEAESIW